MDLANAWLAHGQVLSAQVQANGVADWNITWACRKDCPASWQARGNAARTLWAHYRHDLDAGSAIRMIACRLCTSLDTCRDSGLHHPVSVDPQTNVRPLGMVGYRGAVPRDSREDHKKCWNATCWPHLQTLKRFRENRRKNNNNKTDRQTDGNNESKNREEKGRKKEEQLQLGELCERACICLEVT